MAAAMTRLPPPSRTSVARTWTACAATALLLSACAADTESYPSLQRRPAERISGTAQPVAPDAAPLPPAPPSPELVARLAQLADQAEAAHRDFMGRRARVEQAVAAARGAAVGSEAWSQASVALTDLETARSRAMIALADLDVLYAAELTERGQVPAVAATRERVMTWIAEEDQVLAQLRERLAG